MLNWCLCKERIIAIIAGNYLTKQIVETLFLWFKWLTHETVNVCLQLWLHIKWLWNESNILACLFHLQDAHHLFLTKNTMWAFAVIRWRSLITWLAIGHFHFTLIIIYSSNCLVHVYVILNLFLQMLLICFEWLQTFDLLFLMTWNYMERLNLFMNKYYDLRFHLVCKLIFIDK